MTEWPIILDTVGAPQDERLRIRSLQGNLGSLGSLCTSFRHAMALSAHAREKAGGLNIISPERAMYSEWHLMAIREGGMLISHFSDVMVGSSALLDGCPSISKRVDRRLINNALERLSQLFPDFRILRDGIAHRHEIFSRPSELKKNSINGGKMYVFLYSDFGLDMTKNKREVSYRLSEESASGLEEIRDIYCSAFEDAKAGYPFNDKPPPWWDENLRGPWVPSSVRAEQLMRELENSERSSPSPPAAPK